MQEDSSLLRGDAAHRPAPLRRHSRVRRLTTIVLELPLRLWRIAFWVCLAAVLTLSLMSDVSPSLSTGWDKGNHLLAFAVLALLGRVAYPGRLLLIVVGLLGYGILIELLQSLTGYRVAEFKDLIADALGILLGCLLAAGETWLRRRLHEAPAAR